MKPLESSRSGVARLAVSRRHKASYRRNKAREQARQHNGDHVGDSHENHGTHYHFYGASHEAEQPPLARTISSALGSMTVVANGLEYYAKGVHLLQKPKVEREFRKMRNFLGVETGVLMAWLEPMLQDHDHSDDILKVLSKVDNPLILEQSLRQSLGASSAEFASAAKILRQRVAEIQSALQIGSEGKGPFVLEKQSVRHAFSIIEYGFRLKPIWSILKSIEHCTKRLMRSSEQDSVPSPIGKPKANMGDIETHRAHARDLFDLLSAALEKGCDLSHVACLCMSPVACHPTKINQAVEDAASLRVILEHKYELESDRTPLWVVQEAEITVTDQDKSAWRDLSGGNRKVRFEQVVSVQLGRNRTSGQRQAEDIQMLNLCESIYHWRQSGLSNGDYLGRLSGAGSSITHNLHFPEDPITNRDACSALKLENILQKEGPHRLRLLDRRRLALSIAHGMLRFYGTPWINDQWSKERILIYRSSEFDQHSHHACVAASFDATPEEQPSNLGPSHALIRNQALFALGILLIELELETPFETLLASAEDMHASDVSRLICAQRLVEELYHCASPRYYDVVRRCVSGEFEHHKPSLLDPKVQKLVFSSVILELRAEVQWLEQSLGRC